MSSDKVVTLTKENFDATIASGVCLVDFWAAWCGPCRMVGPVVDELAGELAGKAVVGKVNVDDHPDLAGRYAVRSIPTVIVFRDGKEAERIVGASQKARYAQAVLSRI
jgi:thioredoxin 1